MMHRMYVLTVSDQVEDRLYQSAIKELFPETRLVLSCGDLPHHYIEYLQDNLNVPVYFVHGNHVQHIEYSNVDVKNAPMGAVNLHKKFVQEQGLLISGLEGCLRYRAGRHQYSQAEMWLFVFQLIPGLIWNKIRYGRYLDIFMSHAPPWKINSGEDRAHQGFKAFRWLLKVFRPKYHFHGHVHVYSSSEIVEVCFEDTLVINTYRYRYTKLKEWVR